ncbi:MAG: PilZ domain-containing protein [Novosphingobium sp.]
MSYLNEGDDQIGRRRSRRALFRADVQFGHKGKRCKVSILDLSQHGIKIRAIHKLNVGDEFWIKLPGIAPLSAHVTWARDFVIGCEFTTALHPAMFEAILQGRLMIEPEGDAKNWTRRGKSKFAAG